MQQKLRSAELDLDAKEQRAADAARLRKKAVKKSQRLAAEMENYEALAQTCERLQTREQALLEAVEALSTQNEDLISKLKASMGRELELRSVPGPVFSQALHPLPAISRLKFSRAHVDLSHSHYLFFLPLSFSSSSF